MTEFTSEFISICREEAKVLEDDGYKAFTLALDHIEQQAKQIEELEEEKQAGWVKWLEGVNVHLFNEQAKRIEELEQEGADKDEYIVRTGITIVSKLDEPLKELEEFKNRITKLEELLDIVDDKKQTVFEVLTNTIARRDERIAELEQERRWIPVEDQLPKKSGFYFLHICGADGKKWERVGLFFVDGQFDVINDKVTHWKPIPQPPSEEE